MPLTSEEFKNAVNQLVSEGHPISLVNQVNRYVDHLAQVVIDEGTGADITPSQSVLDQALIGYNAVVIVKESEDTLINLSRSDMLIYYRNALVSAAGSGAAIATLYTQVKAYEAQNLKLTDTMLSLQRIEEVSSGVNIDIGTNQGKARYLQLFQTALVLWR